MKTGIRGKLLVFSKFKRLLQELRHLAATRAAVSGLSSFCGDLISIFPTNAQEDYLPILNPVCKPLSSANTLKKQKYVREVRLVKSISITIILSI